MKTPFKTASVLMLAAASMLVLSACAAPALAQTTTPTAPTDQPHTISVTGSGTAYGAPDIATAQIGVQTRDADAVKATSSNSTKMAAIIAALKAQGVQEKDIQTTNFSVSAQQDVDASGQPKGTITFIVNNTFHGIQGGPTGGESHMEFAGGVTYTAVPEPGTWAMLLGGFGLLVGFQRVRRKKS